MNLIRVSEAAVLLQVSTKTVRNMIDRGRFPGAAKIDPTRRNSPYRIPLEEVKSLIQHHHQDKSDDPEK